MTTRKLLSQRTINCLVNSSGKDDLLASIQRLASARENLTFRQLQQKQHLHSHNHNHHHNNHNNHHHQQQQVRHLSSLSRSNSLSTSSQGPTPTKPATPATQTIASNKSQAILSSSSAASWSSSSMTNKQHVRLTSTTPPAASSIQSSANGTGSPSAATSTASPSSSQLATTTNIHLKRDASTQAKHQQQQLILDQVNEHRHGRSPYELNDDDEGYGDEVDKSFRSSDLVTLQCSPGELKPKPSVDQLIFGHVFTDHMFQVEWDHDKGWSTPLITKIHNLDIHPGAKVLHYAVEAFEGAKAYRGHDNKIRFFRLDQNIKRLLRSSRRLALPDFDEFELIKCIHKLVNLDQEWIPPLQQGGGKQQQLTSLYIRPTIMGMDASLGVASSRKSLLYVLLSPVGPYFKTGFRPISLYADPSFVRAWPGGAGNAKLGSNYAPTIMVQKQAERLGLQQVLWLYGDDMKLTEVGTMNIFVALQNNETGKTHLITPPLSDGLVLPGITRASILDIARQWSDVVCEERYVTIGELKQLIHEKRLIEMFGAGTACVVCPVNGIQMKDGTRLRIPFTDVTKDDTGFPSGQQQSVSLTKRILRTITDIQYGRTPHPWAQELIHN